MTKRVHCTRKHHEIENPPSDGWPPMASVGTDRSGPDRLSERRFQPRPDRRRRRRHGDGAQAIAYAYLAGLPPQAGLYACLLPMLIYGVFGSSKHLVVGPVAVAALLVASAIAQHAPRYGDAHLMISSILCLQVGLILFALRASTWAGL